MASSSSRTDKLRASSKNDVKSDTDLRTRRKSFYNKINEASAPSTIGFLKNQNVELTQEEIEEIREVFTLFDKNGEGSIPTKELGVVLKSLGQNPTEAELEDLINEIDIDHNGVIDFNEFCVMMREFIKEPEPDDVKATFQVFDRDGKGFITADDLAAIMRNLGEKTMTKQEFDDMINAGDIDKDGKVTYEDFFIMMTSKHPEDAMPLKR